ncbi:MAG: hypothetical protein KKF48_01375 [Nanoarchaeota archaeon]|nr:hypothetical protein [Nanoarchaeota archaeon]MBU1027673.1 hypothetical protein [Nanoarchaeota archaeon]
MKSKNLIHVKFEYDEGMDSKKGMLFIELGLLKIARTIKQYKAYRLEELNLRAKLHRKLSEIKTGVVKLEANLPKLKISGKLKEHEQETKTKVDIKESEYDEDLERQLQDIQSQLSELSR